MCVQVDCIGIYVTLASSDQNTNNYSYEILMYEDLHLFITWSDLRSGYIVICFLMSTFVDIILHSVQKRWSLRTCVQVLHQQKGRDRGVGWSYPQVGSPT